MGTVLEAPQVVSKPEPSLKSNARELTRGCLQTSRHLWVEGPSRCCLISSVNRTSNPLCWPAKNDHAAVRQRKMPEEYRGDYGKPALKAVGCEN